MEGAPILKGTIFMKMEKSCGAIVFTRDSGEIRYVLVQQKEGFHGFPKGHMEEGETERETALREIHEELGLKPQLIEGFVTTDEHPIPGKNVIKQMVYFLAEYSGQEIVIQEDELLAAPVVTYEEGMALFEYESSRRMLTEANDFLTNS